MSVLGGRGKKKRGGPKREDLVVEGDFVEGGAARALS